MPSLLTSKKCIAKNIIKIPGSITTWDAKNLVRPVGVFGRQGGVVVNLSILVHPAVDFLGQKIAGRIYSAEVASRTDESGHAYLQQTDDEGPLPHSAAHPAASARPSSAPAGHGGLPTASGQGSSPAGHTWSLVHPSRGN